MQTVRSVMWRHRTFFRLVDARISREQEVAARQGLELHAEQRDGIQRIRSNHHVRSDLGGMRLYLCEIGEYRLMKLDEVVIASFAIRLEIRDDVSAEMH